MRHAGLIACLALLGACAPLTAERSLFSVADQIGPTPLTEGRWVQGGDGCAPGEAASEADACVTVDVARDRDGAWLYTMRSSADEVADSHWRFIIAPATETARGEDYAPLYLAEYNSLDDETPPFYAVVAPVGVMPAREVRMVTMIDCDDVLREGQSRASRSATPRKCLNGSVSRPTRPPCAKRRAGPQLRTSHS